MIEHANSVVQHAIVALSDALCAYERTTGLRSVLIIREQGGFIYRAASGKPGIPDAVTDTYLIDLEIHS
jgi:uncharacterized membrane protein